MARAITRQRTATLPRPERSESEYPAEDVAAIPASKSNDQPPSVPRRGRASSSGRRHGSAGGSGPTSQRSTARKVSSGASQAPSAAELEAGLREKAERIRRGESPAVTQPVAAPTEHSEPVAVVRAPRKKAATSKRAASRSRNAPAASAKPEKAAKKAPERKSRAPRAPKPIEKKASPKASVGPAPALARGRARVPVTGAPTDNVPAPFAHNAEYEFARILDFYGIDWQYEPRTFPLRWDRGHVTEAFSPDFYLPDLNMYVELTTLKPGLTAEKNRKMRLLKELYPGTNIIMLKKQDYLRLLAKYGYGPLSADQVPDIDRVLVTTGRLQKRVAELGAQISHDYTGKELVMVGVLRGVLCFIADIMRNVSVPSAVDLMAISSYDGNGSNAVRILKDLDENIKGRDVLLVEDIVDTGMTLNHIVEYLQTKKPASIKICTLLDKRARRIVNVPLDYVGFEIPDEFVVGYGLDYNQRFRNLPFIAVLKHDLLP
jgi:hypoxanthine phosphoribosyltransferase